MACFDLARAVGLGQVRLPGRLAPLAPGFRVFAVPVMIAPSIKRPARPADERVVVPPAGSASPGARSSRPPRVASPSRRAIGRLPHRSRATFAPFRLRGFQPRALPTGGAGPALCSPAGDATPLGQRREGGDRSTGCGRPEGEPVCSARRVSSRLRPQRRPRDRPARTAGRRPARPRARRGPVRGRRPGPLRDRFVQLPPAPDRRRAPARHGRSGRDDPRLPRPRCSGHAPRRRHQPGRPGDQRGRGGRRLAPPEPDRGAGPGAADRPRRSRAWSWTTCAPPPNATA